MNDKNNNDCYDNHGNAMITIVMAVLLTIFTGDFHI